MIRALAFQQYALVITRTTSGVLEARGGQALMGPLRHILVIDDEQSLLDLIGDSLQLLGGYTVTVAHDGIDGLEQVAAHPPDCVIVDVRMPHLNGFQFVQAMRGDPATVQIPLLILSALVQQRDALSGLLSGADAYLTKPVRMTDLLEAIDRAVNLTPIERAQRACELADTPFPPQE